MRRSGLQAEVVLRLAFVMLAATGILAVVLLQHGEARLRGVLGRALVAEAEALPDLSSTLIPGTLWWRLPRVGEPDARLADGTPLDDESRALSVRARREGTALLQPGAPWQAIRFAAPLGSGGDVQVARLPVAASLRLRGIPMGLALGLLVADVALFTGFGASLLRRRLVTPLRRLAAATRAVADGGFETRLPLDGPREAVEVAAAFNDMSEALERRTNALEKAVHDLREANSQLRRARQGLDRAERLASVGRLAAGVAHEVGNPMGALLAFLDVAGRDGGLSDETRGYLGRAAQQGERVRRILRQLLEFSNPTRTERVALDVGALAQEAIGLVRAQRHYAQIDFAVEVDDRAPQAAGDPGVVTQILLNLVLNAADAALAREREAGETPARVVLEVRPEATDVRAGEPPEAASRRQQVAAVVCVVADDGAGVAEEDRERIFDPFFTTKPPGEGTGLGLANSLRLAEELGGALVLDAPPSGMATAFALRLPAWDCAPNCEVRTNVRGSGVRGGSDPN